MSENREEFQRDLERIEAKVIELFAMVAEDLPRATEALLSGDNDALAVLIEREQIIDALWPEIEELVNREIVLQAPVAVDLRYLLSVLRIVPVLERAHDLVISIGEPGQSQPRRGADPAQQGACRADERTRVRHVAAGGRRLVSARQDRRVLAERTRRGDGRAAFQPDRRAGLWPDVGAGGYGDGAGGARLRAPRRARGQHRPPGGLPGGLQLRRARQAADRGYPIRPVT